MKLSFSKYPYRYSFNCCSLLSCFLLNLYFQSLRPNRKPKAGFDVSSWTFRRKNNAYNCDEDEKNSQHNWTPLIVISHILSSQDLHASFFVHEKRVHHEQDSNRCGNDTCNLLRTKRTVYLSKQYLSKQLFSKSSFIIKTVNSAK